MLGFNITRVGGIGEYTIIDEKQDGELKRRLYKVRDKAFLVVNKNTLEVRTDEKLAQLLTEQYESVMQSRYYGRGGIEIVDSGQLSPAEIDDLIRLSYNLTI